MKLTFKAHRPLFHNHSPSPPPHFFLVRYPFSCLLSSYLCPAPSQLATIFHQIIFNRMPFSHVFLFRSSYYHSSLSSFRFFMSGFSNVFPTWFPCLYSLFPSVGCCCGIKTFHEHLLLLTRHPPPLSPQFSFNTEHIRLCFFFLPTQVQV